MISITPRASTGVLLTANLILWPIAAFGQMDHSGMDHSKSDHARPAKAGQLDDASARHAKTKTKPKKKLTTTMRIH